MGSGATKNRPEEETQPQVDEPTGDRMEDSSSNHHVESQGEHKGSEGSGPCEDSEKTDKYDPMAAQLKYNREASKSWLEETTPLSNISFRSQLSNRIIKHVDSLMTMGRKPARQSDQNSENLKQINEFDMSLSQEFIQMVNELVEVIDEDKDGKLNLRELQVYLSVLDSNFETLSQSHQKNRAKAFLKTFPNVGNKKYITVENWTAKAYTTLLDGCDNHDLDSWNAIQKDAVDEAKHIIDALKARRKKLGI